MGPNPKRVQAGSSGAVDGADGLTEDDAIAQLSLLTGWTIDYIANHITPAQTTVMLLSADKKRRRDAQYEYLATKIAMIEAFSGKEIDHGLFDDPTVERKPQDASDAMLATMGIFGM